MKKVMAEAASASEPQRPRDAATRESKPVPQLHQNHHLSSRPVNQTTISHTNPTTGTSSPRRWNIIEGHDTSLSHPSSFPPSLDHSAYSSAAQMKLPPVSAYPRPHPSPPSALARSLGSHSGLGPVITPTRQPPSSIKSSTPFRRVSYVSISRFEGPYLNYTFSGKAWNQLHAHQSSSVSSLTPGASFVAIQQLELEQVAGYGESKRSFLEIQEEERALQQEAEFLAWWTAEEERIKLEAEINTPPQNTPPKQTKKRAAKNQIGMETVRNSPKGNHRKSKSNWQGNTTI
jgi:hypothetical protein